jgi:hypothetical protein
MKHLTYIVALALVLTLILSTTSCAISSTTNDVITNNEPVVEEEFSNEVLFDISALKEWNFDSDIGTVRMVGGWLYEDSTAENALQIVEDEQGQLWYINETVSDDDYLLLWIADNNTPNDPTDDIMLCVWVEAF